MASISATTMHKVGVKKPKGTSKSNTGKSIGTGGIISSKTKTKAKTKQSIQTKTKQSTMGSRGRAPKMTPKIYNHPVKIQELNELSGDDAKLAILDRMKIAFGESASLFQETEQMQQMQQIQQQHSTSNNNNKNSGIKRMPPHAASTSMDRSQAAADVAVAAKHLGLVRVLKQYGVLEWIERMIIPNGIGAVFQNADGTTNGGGMKKIASSVSLASMNSAGAGTGGSLGDGDSFLTGMSDSKRGKTSPPTAREGALFILRALCEIVGKTCEPFVIPLLAAALEECCSSNSNVRTAAEDTSKAMIQLVSPLAAPYMICPVLFAAMKSTEWRVKVNALDRLSELASVAPSQVSQMLPKIIPAVTDTVFDTKPQVTKAAKQCLQSTCDTNLNPDVSPAIPAIVNAIVKPADTIKAVDELMGTTFVATVDASTLAILCPILSRGLKDKMAVNKRSCCLVIQNMSRLVETPEAVAPFGPLLVPDLKKVAENVQFEEIRDTALAALATLTKALGHGTVEEAVASIMAEETQRVLDEQERIQQEREEEVAREEAARIKEIEERKLWKEAMEAQRKLDQLAEKEEEEKKKEKLRKIAKQKTKVKTAGGKCQGCGLKKCKKGCLFY